MQTGHTLSKILAAYNWDINKATEGVLIIETPDFIDFCSKFYYTYSVSQYVLDDKMTRQLLRDRPIEAKLLFKAFKLLQKSSTPAKRQARSSSVTHVMNSVPTYIGDD